ncbi:hypothetical protein PanWU01x14_226640 [Parasponia andersonii]|uniref:Uncharacterized protein n=1 Tax=Parasponia andersonii TaxID=3476 RepID=A0A2P5BMK6_PARAD|nr:hypothetical protein PanWU01x14_226640 [Parasponia andersonii]
MLKMVDKSHNTLGIGRVTLGNGGKDFNLMKSSLSKLCCTFLDLKSNVPLKYTKSIKKQKINKLRIGEEEVCYWNNSAKQSNSSEGSFHMQCTHAWGNSSESLKNRMVSYIC